MRHDPRGAILEALRMEGPRTATELAASLRFTPGAARVHLRRLEAEQLVTPTLERRPQGRPVARYALTPEADARFPRRHDLFASRFVATVIRLYGTEALERALSEWEESLLQRLDAILPDAPAERLEALARHQTEHGFMAAVRNDEDGVALVEHNCPILDLAKAHPEICAMESSLFSRVLKWKTTLDSCQATGGSACVFRIGRNRASGNR